MTGKFINFVFMEELEDLGANGTVKTAIFGATTVLETTEMLREKELNAMGVEEAKAEASKG